jgi:hypothetical protein
MELIPPTAKKRGILQLSNFSMFVLYCTVGQREVISIQSTIVSVPSSELAPPSPSHKRLGVPPTLILGSGHTRFRWRGWGSQFRRPSKGLCAEYRIYTYSCI